MKATAIAPANIAFIKYWGKTDPQTRIPRNTSISMNLSHMTTTTTVSFDPSYTEDSFQFIGEKVVTEKEVLRVTKALSFVREKTGSTLYAKVVTKNSFPKATGIASSASGFASLAAAAFAALSYPIQPNELSSFCRKLSGTACRSIPDGFVQWAPDTTETDSYGVMLHPPEYWDLVDTVAIVEKSMKKVSSTEGHALAVTSPFYNARMEGMPEKVEALKSALSKKDFVSFGGIMEAEALNMHAICLTSTPPLLYWEPATIAIMKRIWTARNEEKKEIYVTIDAGPSVHVISRQSDGMYVSSIIKEIPGVKEVVVNTPAVGVRISNEHLF